MPACSSICLTRATQVLKRSLQFVPTSLPIEPPPLRLTGSRTGVRPAVTTGHNVRDRRSVPRRRIVATRYPNISGPVHSRQSVNPAARLPKQTTKNSRHRFWNAVWCGVCLSKRCGSTEAIRVSVFSGYGGTESPLIGTTGRTEPWHLRRALNGKGCHSSVFVGVSTIAPRSKRSTVCRTTPSFWTRSRMPGRTLTVRSHREETGSDLVPDGRAAATRQKDRDDDPRRQARGATPRGHRVGLPRRVCLGRTPAGPGDPPRCRSRAADRRLGRQQRQAA